MMEKEAKYPDMEKRLAKWTIETRKGGVPVETWMVANEGNILCTSYTHYHLLIQVNLVTTLSSSVIIGRNGYSRGTMFFEKNIKEEYLHQR